jgi:tRNA-Thr(GGU) m(6)t(6)A37 methyltransferase TsaA
MKEIFKLYPVGVVRKKGENVFIEIGDEYADGLLGLEGFSHVVVFFWFHQNDTPDKRSVLRVLPRKDPRNPLTGVFATHSPQRPNLIGMTICKILSIRGNRIEIEDIDAFDGSPVIDIKCYIPSSVKKKDVSLPVWIQK